MRLYFAYGSNMSRAQMRRRCPAARAVGAASLDGWRFAINARGTATIRPAPGDVVHGVLWRMTARDVATLDVFEGVARRRYIQRVVRVRTSDGALVVALTYIGLNPGRGRAVRAYLEGTIIPAAEAWQLPEAAMRRLRDAAGGPMLGPGRPHPRKRGWRP